MRLPKIKFLGIVLLLCLGLMGGSTAWAENAVPFKLGDERLLSEYYDLVQGKNVGLITNQTGVDSQGISTIDKLAADPGVNLVALFTPEHGLDGTAKAGDYVVSYTHPTLGIPVNSLYGETRTPTASMLQGIEVLVFDIQDLGSRTYTYASTLNYCMKAAVQYGIKVVVLDRPNPVGGVIVEGPVMEDECQTFVGVDNLPMAHGMTICELASFYNREIGADLALVPMSGYYREMIFQDTGLNWVPTSPNIPDIDAAFCYMATGLGEGTGIGASDYFKWVGGSGVDGQKLADLLNNAGLEGVYYTSETRGQTQGVRLNITDYHKFNPCRSGYYMLAYARIITGFTVPQSDIDKSGSQLVMFDKIMGSRKIGQALLANQTPQQIEADWADNLNAFKAEREKYLLYGYANPSDASTEADPALSTQDETSKLQETAPAAPEVTPKGVQAYYQDKLISFDTQPYIDANNRVIVPVRAIATALGMEVQWEPNTKKVYCTRDNNQVVFTIGQIKALVNGQSLTMDTVPAIKDGRTMIPLRYVSEYLGSQVEWEADTKTVRIY